MDTFELVCVLLVSAVYLGFGLFYLRRGLVSRRPRKSFDRWVDKQLTRLDSEQWTRIEVMTSIRWRRVGVGMIAGLGVASALYWCTPSESRLFMPFWQLCLVGLLVGQAVDAFTAEASERRGAPVRVASSIRASVSDVVNPTAVVVMVVGLLAQVVSVLLALRVLVRASEMLRTAGLFAPAASVTIAIGAGITSIAAIAVILRRPAVATSVAELECILALRRARIQQLVGTFFFLGYLVYQLPSDLNFAITTDVSSAAYRQVSTLQWSIGLPGGLLMMIGLCLSNWAGPGPRVDAAPDFPEEKPDRSGSERRTPSPRTVG